MKLMSSHPFGSRSRRTAPGAGPGALPNGPYVKVLLSSSLFSQYNQLHHGHRTKLVQEHGLCAIDLHLRVLRPGLDKFTPSRICLLDTYTTQPAVEVVQRSTAEARYLGSREEESPGRREISDRPISQARILKLTRLNLRVDWPSK